MKNALTLSGLITLLLFAVGCQNPASSREAALEESQVPAYSEENLSEISSEENGATEQKDDLESEEEGTLQAIDAAEQEPGLTFADLSKRRFEFSSGAGAWSENFTIEKDGYFKGLFHDSDAGSTGEGYENGTRYSSSYSGHFTDLVQINEYTYEMKLKDISYTEEVGTEEIEDGILYVYTTSSCFRETDTFQIYLPGTPLSELSEEVYLWIAGANESEAELTMIIITNEAREFGIYSYERMAPLEDAQMQLNSMKTACKTLQEELDSVSSTPEMLALTEAMYENSDYCLNYIWDLVHYNVEEAEYQKLLNEQLAWISEKERAAQEAYDEWEGGSHAPVDYVSTLHQLTMERCEELIEYLK